MLLSSQLSEIESKAARTSKGYDKVIFRVNWLSKTAKQTFKIVISLAAGQSSLSSPKIAEIIPAEVTDEDDRSDRRHFSVVVIVFVVG